MQILLIDNYDSFTYNLYHMVEALLPEGWSIRVKRNDATAPDDLLQADALILSPGPGLPAQAGITCDAIRLWGAEKPILGVCLGLQAITEVFGGKLINLEQVLHGVAVPTCITDPQEVLFQHMPSEILTGRYHSWAPDPASTPDCLRITAIDSHGNIMAMTHRTLNIRGVQFHPESVLTPQGNQMLKNWIEAIAQPTPGSRPV